VPHLDLADGFRLYYELHGPPLAEAEALHQRLEKELIIGRAALVMG